ncbi:MAG: isopeptide-forming domain-containing fimbrial protein, partial [Bacteroidetes bacterium]|nr:isopeptide-forming domain-containing fimbrial protein [Bacteroidota bacterium]
MRHRYAFSLLLGILLHVLFTSQPALSQSYMSQAAQHGFTLKKVVSDTAIATGQSFSYTVYFSIPAGSMAVTITDVLPPALSFQSISVTSACGSPTVSAPAVNSMGGTVSLTWPSVPSGCSGSFVVTVNFPNGTTCDGTTARNNVCLTGEIGSTFADFCTGYVSTRAMATNPWNIGKWILGAGSQPGPCNKITADSVVTYQICVWKNVGTTGQLNMENAVVTDTLPPGAILVPGSSSCGMTQTGNVITWNIGSLSALSMYNTQCCTFDVLYPSSIFPTGSQINNRATLRGALGSANAPCGPAVHNSNETCVEIKQVTSATFSKYAYTNGQPGCGGMFRIWICNNGSLPISALTVTDTIPAALSGLSLGTVSSGLSASLTGNILTATLSSPLAPTQCRYIEINFTIPSTATTGSTITNCAWLNFAGLPPQQACAAFTVNAPAPNPCLWKEVCNKQASYQPGDVFRYRLRVQNIGGQPITGATITDVLNPNLQFVGNLSYYTGTAWNAPCQTTSNWTGVGFSQSGQTLTFTLPPIAATCQNIFYNSCGMYGSFGVPFYFIEFDVKVSDTTALGNIPNNFSIAGGNLIGATTSNTDYVNVVGTSGFFLDKAVAPDTTSWASSVTTAASSTVNYRLQLTVAPGSVGLRHVTFADLLPRDNGTADQLILGPCSPRGSIFDVSYLSTVSTTPLSTAYGNPLSFATVNNFAPAGAPGAMFTGACGTTGMWSSGLSAGDMNLGWYFGSSPLGAGNSATSIFSASVPPTAAPPDSACNTFAANAAVRHLINSSVISDQQIGPLESGAACVLVDKGSTGKDTCFSVQLQSVTSSGVNAVGECEYSVVVSVTNPASSPLSGWFASDQGSVTPGSLSIPSGTSTQTLTFTDTAPADNFVCIRYGILDVVGQRILCDSICFDLPPCEESDPCDSVSVKQASTTSTGVDGDGNCTYTVSLSMNNTGSSPIPVWFDSFTGTVSPAVLTVPTGSST